MPSLALTRPSNRPGLFRVGPGVSGSLGAPRHDTGPLRATRSWPRPTFPRTEIAWSSISRETTQMETTGRQDMLCPFGPLSWPRPTFTCVPRSAVPSAHDSSDAPWWLPEVIRQKVGRGQLLLETGTDPADGSRAPPTAGRPEPAPKKLAAANLFFQPDIGGSPPPPFRADSVAMGQALSARFEKLAAANFCLRPEIACPQDQRPLGCSVTAARNCRRKVGRGQL